MLDELESTRRLRDFVHNVLLYVLEYMRVYVVDILHTWSAAFPAIFRRLTTDKYGWIRHAVKSALFNRSINHYG